MLPWTPVTIYRASVGSIDHEVAVSHCVRSLCICMLVDCLLPNYSQLLHDNYFFDLKGYVKIVFVWRYCSTCVRTLILLAVQIPIRL